MIKPLTSLRFIFAFLVFMSHFIIFPQNEYPFLHHIFFEGYVGVSFFFILSGFILAYNYQERFANKLIDKKTFYISRLARIYPLHIFTMLIWIWMKKDVPLDSTYATNFILNILLLQSFYPIEGIKFNAVSWSLSDEMFFYLLFPFIIYWLIKSRRSFLPAFVLAITVLIALVYIYRNNDLAEWIFYTNPVSRVMDFAMGIGLYNICKSGILDKWRTKISPTLLEIAGICILVGFYSSAIFIPQVYRHAMWYWIPVSVLIYIFYYQAGTISKFLSRRILVLLGEISFSFYMFHTMVLWYVQRAFTLSNTQITPLLLFIISLGTTIIVSYLSYKYLEIPANRWIKRTFLKKEKTASN